MLLLTVRMHLACASFVQIVPHHDWILERCVERVYFGKPLSGQAEQILELVKCKLGQIVLARHEQLVVFVERKEVGSRVRMLACQATHSTVSCTSFVFHFVSETFKRLCLSRMASIE